MFKSKDKGAPKAAQEKKADAPKEEAPVVEAPKSKSQAKRLAVVGAKWLCPKCGHLRKALDKNPGVDVCKGCEEAEKADG